MVSMMKENNPKGYEVYVSMHNHDVAKETPVAFIFRMVFRFSSFIVALFIPILGLCIYILMRDHQPKEAKYPGIATVISFSIYIGYFVFLIVTYTIFSRPASWGGLSPLLPEFSSDFIIPFPIN